MNTQPASIAPSFARTRTNAPAPVPSTLDAYLDAVAGKYRASCYLGDLTCARLAAVALCRELRATLGSRCTYKAARRLLGVPVTC